MSSARSDWCRFTRRTTFYALYSASYSREGQGESRHHCLSASIDIGDESLCRIIILRLWPIAVPDAGEVSQKDNGEDEKKTNKDRKCDHPGQRNSLNAVRGNSSDEGDCRP